MSWDQYWYGDVRMTGAFLEAEKLRLEQENYQRWLQGRYVFDAICAVAPVLVTMPKKDAKILPYPEPYPLFEQRETEAEREAREEQERLRARLYMSQMVRAGKGWGG